MLMFQVARKPANRRGALILPLLVMPIVPPMHHIPLMGSKPNPVS